MTISFISKTDKKITHFAHFDVETEKQRDEIIKHYKQQVKKGLIYGYSVIS